MLTTEEEWRAGDASAFRSRRLLATDGSPAIGMFLVAAPVAQCDVREEQGCHGNEDRHGAAATVTQRE